jgi:hypothetical protein
MAGPTRFTGALSTSATRSTACGLPIDSTATSTACPAASSGQSGTPFSSRGVRPLGSKGSASGSKTGAPMSTVTRPSGCSVSSSTRLTVRTRTEVLSVSPCSRT